MKTIWKLALTFAVLSLFILVIAFVMAALVSDMEFPSLMGGYVAVIPIHGPIMMSGCGGGIFASADCVSVENVKEELRKADGNPSVSAILLDISSGGGQVVASRELMREIKRTNKPVVAWIGEVGASGAYYAASSADLIVADETSMTGSIGVRMEMAHYYELLEAVGVNITVIKAGESKDIGSPYRPMTKEEEQELKKMVEGVYDSFLSDIAENRGMSMDYVRSIAGGRIYLGLEAEKIGLVDDLGGFEYALERASELGKIRGEPKVLRPKKPPSWTDLL